MRHAKSRRNVMSRQVLTRCGLRTSQSTLPGSFAMWLADNVEKLQKVLPQTRFFAFLGCFGVLKAQHFLEVFCRDVILFAFSEKVFQCRLQLCLCRHITRKLRNFQAKVLGKLWSNESDDTREESFVLAIDGSTQTWPHGQKKWLGPSTQPGTQLRMHKKSLLNRVYNFQTIQVNLVYRHVKSTYFHSFFRIFKAYIDVVDVSFEKTSRDSRFRKGKRKTHWTWAFEWKQKKTCEELRWKCICKA